MRSLVLAWSIGLLLTGCYRWPDTDNPVQVEGAPFLPWGVIASDAQRKLTDFRGIHPSDRHDRCCIVGPDATITVRSPAVPHHLYLDLWNPDFHEMFGVRGQARKATIVIGRYRETRSLPEPSRLGELKYTLPQGVAVKAGTLSFRLHIDYFVIPQQVSESMDSRALAIVLRGVTVD